MILASPSLRAAAVVLALAGLRASRAAHPEPAATQPAAETRPDQPPPDKVTKYQPVPADEQPRLLERLRAIGPRVNEKLGTKLRAVETDRFLIFTNWPAQEDRVLGEMLESIYRRLSQPLEIPAGENVYYGKLVVFCWALREEFTRLAREIDQFPIGRDDVAYVIVGSDGYQHLNMYRAANRLLLEKIVAHECAHTIIHRYRSNMMLESWLSEGLAELMSAAAAPHSKTLEQARAQARAAPRAAELARLLRAGYAGPAAGDYPLVTTAVDYLVRKDSAKFLAMLDAIKDKTATEAALKSAYGLDYDGLVAAWRRWVAAGFPKP